MNILIEDASLEALEVFLASDKKIGLDVPPRAFKYNSESFICSELNTNIEL